MTKRLRLIAVAAVAFSALAACVPNPQPEQAANIVAGGIHTCAVLGSGTVKCWGNNGWGQLGDGTTADSPAPVVVTGVTALPGVTTVAGGEHHTCAVVAGGAVSCWGRNDSGQVGRPFSPHESTAATIAGLSGATTVAAGDFHTCALVPLFEGSQAGTVKCWGKGTSGQLGDDHFTTSPVPVTVAGITNAVAIGAGGNTTCAALLGGTLWCWGDNTQGKLGIGSNALFVGTPQPVSTATGMFNVVDVSPGYRHTCAHTSTGGVWCWGDESIGQLGNGVAVPGGFSNVPVAVSGMLAGLIDTGSDFTCAELSLQGINCWGRNDLGQVGDGSTTSRYVPTAPTGLSGVVRVTAGDGHACAILVDSSVHCWGWNAFGQLGDGTNVNRLTSVPVVGI
jgi:alpha-tubulin suppressor-like RCC1 family protein